MRLSGLYGQGINTSLSRELLEIPAARSIGVRLLTRPVPLAESEYHSGGVSHGAAAHLSPGAREQGLLFVQELQVGLITGSAMADTILGNGDLCEAQREQADEFHLEAGQPNSSEAFEEDQQTAGGEISTTGQQKGRER